MRISWDSHEKMKIVNDSHENLMSFSPNLMRISRDFRFHVKIGTFSHEIFQLSWASREISHEFLMRFSWVFFSRENWNAFSWESHENVTRFSWAYLGVFSWKLWIWRLMLALNSHEILMRFSRGWNFLTRFSWECSGLMSFSRDSHEILTRFLWDSHEIQVYRYNEHKSNPSFLFFNFFIVRLATFCEVTLAAIKSTTSSASIYIKTCWSQTATVSFKHFPLLVAHNTSLVKLKLHHSPQTVKFDLRLASVMYTERKKKGRTLWVC